MAKKKKTRKRNYEAIRVSKGGDDNSKKKSCNLFKMKSLRKKQIILSFKLFPNDTQVSTNETQKDLLELFRL